MLNWLTTTPWRRMRQWQYSSTLITQNEIITQLRTCDVSTTMQLTIDLYISLDTISVSSCNTVKVVRISDFDYSFTESLLNIVLLTLESLIDKEGMTFSCSCDGFCVRIITASQKLNCKTIRHMQLYLK